MVEKYNTHARVRQDLYGIIDVLCVGNGETVGIQSTSGMGANNLNMFQGGGAAPASNLGGMNVSGWAAAEQGPAAFNYDQGF